MKVLRAAASSAALIATLAQGATGTNPQEQDKMNPTAEIAQVSPEPLGRWPAGPCSSWRYGENLTTPAKFNADLERSHRMMRRLASCVFARFDAGPVPEYVIERESGWNPWATNPNDGHSCRPFTGGNYGSCGLAQHLSRYWEGRMRAYLQRDWFRRWPVGPLDPRASLIAMAKMVRAQGGVCPAWCIR